MKRRLIKEYKFNTPNQWDAVFSAPVYYKNGTIYYPYGMSSTRFCRKIEVDGTVEEFSFTFPINMVAHPSDWKLFEYEGHVILSCGNQVPATKSFPDKIVKSIFLDLDDGMKEIQLPIDMEKQNLCSIPVDETADSVLSDCILKYKNSSSYQCFDFSSRLLWTEKHKGYRYTDFEEKDDCIIFGTAGHGGGLYCYRKSDGKCLCAVDTKGTASYIWCRNRIVSRGRNGELLLIDPLKGEIEESIKLNGRMTDCSSFYADGNILCAVGFEEKTHSPCVYVFDTAFDE